VGVLCSLLFAAYWRGWEQARFIVILIVSLGVAIGAPPDTPTVVVLLPPIFALALGDWRWVAGVGIGVLLVLMARGGFEGEYTRIGTLGSYLPTVAAAVLGSLGYDSARIIAERNARQAEHERALAEERAQEVSRQAAELSAQNERQRELLNLVSVLETPAVSVAEGALLAPLVGNLDSRRAEQLTRRLLGTVHERRIRLVILDVAGVPLVDTAVAAAITNTVRSLRLLGCEVVITGISAHVASALTSIGVAFDELRVAASPQEALARHFGEQLQHPKHRPDQH
jgi:rsbT co-antagonist protein RsbR